MHDEGGTFRGTEAIRDWNTVTRGKYHHTVEPLNVVERDGATIVAGRVGGGRQSGHDHVFRLEGDEIVSLEIR